MPAPTMAIESFCCAIGGASPSFPLRFLVRLVWPKNGPVGPITLRLEKREPFSLAIGQKGETEFAAHSALPYESSAL